MTDLSLQLRSWVTVMQQSEIWRFVGFVSAAVGFVSYALSSSFTHLFGHWNFLNIFLYSLFAFIICFITLFAKVWRCSTSILFKAHLAVLVLTATSMYSFFYDKAVNGKPDAYILISFVAFALMSLSLSKQTQCGFELDLLYFFLGCLIVQLMRINLLLAIVGIGFSYSLIILRSSLESGFFELQDHHHVVIQVDSQQANTSGEEPRTMTTARLIKSVTVGDGAVGKTCMLISFVHEAFPEVYVPTVFENYGYSILVDGCPVDLALWDSAGNEDYDRLRPLGYPQTDVFLLCFSLINKDSYESISKKWIHEVRHHAPNVPIVLVGTQLDLRDDEQFLIDHPGATQITTSQGEELKTMIGADTYVECSSKTQQNVKTVFDAAVKVALRPLKAKKKRTFTFL